MKEHYIPGESENQQVFWRRATSGINFKRTQPPLLSSSQILTAISGRRKYEVEREAEEAKKEKSQVREAQGKAIPPRQRGRIFLPSKPQRKLMPLKYTLPKIKDQLL